MNNKRFFYEIETQFSCSVYIPRKYYKGYFRVP